MPEKETKKRAQRAKAKGKSPSSQAGEYVREEMHHIREGKHGARSPEQAIAIGLSKARRAGVDLPAPDAKTTSKETRRAAERDRRRGKTPTRRPSAKRKRATTKALKREGTEAASPKALAKHARKVAAKRGPAKRSAAARKAVRTKGPARRKAAAKKAARTRAARSR